MSVKYLSLFLLLCPLVLAVEEFTDECKKTGIWPETDENCPDAKIYCCKGQLHTVCCSYEAYEEEQNALENPPDPLGTIGKVIIGVVVGCLLLGLLVLGLCCFLPCCLLAKKRGRGEDRGMSMIDVNKEDGTSKPASDQPLVQPPAEP